MAKEVPMGSQPVIKDAVNKQYETVLKGKGTKAVVSSVADSGKASTYGEAGNGKFNKFGYFAKWILDNSKMQAYVSENIKSRNYKAAIDLIRSQPFGNEIKPAQVALQGIILATNPGLENKINAGDEAQVTVQKKMGELSGVDPKTIDQRITDVYKGYAS
ncbi:MAG: hypothetical protein JSW73_03150 [Candidatus Woesearchaeota archaeon]|nr:MAG: hypothetical protein JSW73_03150 [Candidatus Woesearchaeota archaeon]